MSIFVNYGHLLTIAYTKTPETVATTTFPAFFVVRKVTVCNI